jgi:uncharacterized protein (DUF2236 family)
MTRKATVCDGAAASPADGNGDADGDGGAFAFPPDSLLWRVCRERCNLLDGAAAAILQVAHPKIAAGVRDHSDFREGPLARLQRTLDGVNTIAFGTRAQAEAMSARIAARHAAVRGRVGPDDEAGAEYSADDPELLMWVIATLVVAAVVGYERALPPLAAAEKEAFYADMRRFGTHFGLAAHVGPQTWSQFTRYYDRMLADERTGTAEVSRAMAWAVAAPARPWWLGVLSRPGRFAIVETLPSPVRERLGFRRTPWTRFAMAVVNRLMPWVVPVLPARLRFAPQYLGAVKEMKRRKGPPVDDPPAPAVHV